MSARDQGMLLTRALERSAAAAGATIAVTRSDWHRWASATFTGARHEVAFTLLDRSGGRDWLAALPEAELDVPDQLVADLKVARVAADGAGLAVTIEALTVEGC